MYIDEGDIKRSNRDIGYDEKHSINYRSSIIRSFSSLIERNNQFGLKQSNTCRKNLSLLQNEMNIDKKYVNLIINTYEKARYSSEQISKKEYNAYLKAMDKLLI